MIFAAALLGSSRLVLLVKWFLLGGGHLLGFLGILGALRLFDVFLLVLFLLVTFLLVTFLLVAFLLVAFLLVAELLRDLGEVLLEATDGAGMRRGDALSLGGLGLANFDVAIVMVDKSSFLVERSALEMVALLLAGAFANLVDAVHRDVSLGDGERGLVALGFFELAGAGVTGLLTLLAATGDGHCDDAWHDEE